MVSAQTVIKNFRFPEYDEAGRIKSRINGDKAFTLKDETVRIEGLTVQSYTTNGTEEFSVKASTCIFDPEKEIIQSADSILGQSQDGNIRVSGTGFWWAKKENKMVISNKVQMVISKQYLESIKIK
ncbi:LPS export ABC transporter periplasmic protein LptC [Verrucomicrobia bacterium]|nr:LPS export ABC transporter periplasmic protein LptC [Verrucomicrobiota bacterium]